MNGEGEATPISALRAAAIAFRTRPKSVVAQNRLGDELIQLRQVIDVLEVEFAEIAGAFAATDEYELQGSVSPIEWIRHNCKVSGRTAADRVSVGEQSERLRRSVDAVENGRIGFAHLVVMSRTARALDNSATGGGFDESPLLQAAQHLSVGRFGHYCHHARHAADPEGVVRDEFAAVEWRELHLQTCEDGLVSVSGTLDGAGGAALRTALEPLARRCGVDDQRRRSRRMADALVELATNALDTGAVPQRASQRAHLQVTCSVETLLGLAGAPAAEMEFALPISAKAVERISCDSNVTRILLAEDSAVIDVGRSHRVVAGSTRRALNARDKCCRWPGCDRPASMTAAHHIKHWAHGGRTDLSNLVLLCHRHHWMVHEGGWQLVRSEGDALLTIPPRVDLDHLARGPDRARAA
ncbi:MAG TPA: DUF222 domain-containing protein [Candidatus Solibacter sp.]|jgi:hypothetical protein|nr:DUF222 domain-containing protein [Candidatus Solibacter sp.]